MEHKRKLEDLNKESLKKFEEWVEAKGNLKEEDHANLHKAKDDWQAAWAKFMEALIVLERLEI